MALNYLGVLGVKLKYPILLLAYIGGYAPARIYSIRVSWGALVESQMGALWRWARLDPMGLGEVGGPQPRASPDHGNTVLWETLK